MPAISALRLLMSQDAIDRFGPAVSARLDSVPHQLVARESLAESGDAQIDVAFLTKDVSGRSTKTDLSAPLAHFFALLRQSTRLKWVHTHSAGADRPIYAEVIGRGVTVTTSSGLTADTVAQSAVGGVLALARRFPLLQEAQRRRSWEPLIDGRAPRDLKGQVAVVVGLGPIGREIARLLTAIGLHVIGVRTSATADAGCAETVTYADLPAIAPRADWLLLACPLTDLTRQLVDAALLSRLPRGAYLINVARGEVVVEQELVATLQQGQLAGAFLDVFELEPLAADSPLWSLPNVMVTPHTASHSVGYYTRVGELFLDNLSRWVDGKALVNDATRYRQSAPG